MGETPCAENNTIKQEQTERFLCSSCGGNMVFEPKKQKLVCLYCSNESEVNFEKTNIIENDFYIAENTKNKNWEKEKRIIKCESCGAQTLLDENSTAQFCAFCGSSHIIKTQEVVGIVPESLIPFVISKDAAGVLFSNWIKKLFFAPRALKSSYNMNKMKGVYIPFWTYDSHTFSDYTAERGTYYYVTETEWVEEDGERKQVTKQVRKTSWSYVSGDYSKFYDDILINASAQINNHIISKLEPFNLKELVLYKPEFLSGFLAERYSIDLKSGWKIAEEKIESDLRGEIRQHIGGDEVRNLSFSTAYDAIKFKHILLPIWISAYIYKTKVYRFMINGQTGEVDGESPASIVKVMLLILAILAVIGGAYFYFSNK
ncbi:hypothetical protein LGL55_04225 [Clostridium tagluense]|uniref:hypothetical protein n=1 Tax=Clostridium tagluense TaxID=360422 RepID=UPI001CF10D62|nr:hypothetical protein [Clostridium tagluense]MCB2310328.1 hypothetical protein [Clostridium tagluense]MCB2315030.1 hypothetical protein [Clostridium tagluense]MCB2320028.1 hypothetical protein [Clostridium tagluense]MCB2324773.1 hypothetical protein [Clostridium tagluense]MCB2329773.1 hypothetical protein [Clostridium tagluense]